MDNLQGRSSSAADAKIASVVLDVHFVRGNGGRSRWAFPDEKDVFAAIPRWQFRDYSERCAGCFHQQRFAEMTFDGNNLMEYDRNRRACDTAVGSYVRQCKALGKTCSGIFLGLQMCTCCFYGIVTWRSTFSD